MRASGRNHAAYARDEAALQRDMAMRGRLHAAGLCDRAAEARAAAARAGAEAAAGNRDAGRLARMWEQAAWKSQELADEREAAAAR